MTDTLIVCNEGQDYLSVIVDIFNIIIIIAFFIITYLADRRARFNERKAIWYKELIIQPHLERINNFFSELFNLIENKKALILNQSTSGDLFSSRESLVKKLIEDSNDKLTAFRRDFIDIVYSMNENFAQDLYSFLDQLQDELNGRIEKLLTNPKLSFEDIIRTKRVLLFNKLFVNEYLNPEYFLRHSKNKKK
jgi:hypothetical protein